MSWQLVNKPTTLKVTRKLAKEFSEMEPAPNDRPLSERRLQVYERLFREGQFRPVTWAKALCTETNDLYRVNGKHTSVLLSGIEPLPEFFVTVEEYVCDTLEDVARLYATFDSQMMSRTAKDINLSFAGTVPELAACSQKAVNLAVSGMAYHLGRYYSTTAPERAELLLEHPEFVLWLQSVFAGPSLEEKNHRESRHLSRYPVSAAMFATWTKAKGAATEFWAAVRDETGTTPNLPDRTLAKYLLTSGVNVGGGAKRVRRSEPREMYVKCLHAWNAWRKGETTRLSYFAEADVPAVK